jgi:transcriptional regulator of aromatic amino acid metabolism
MTDARGSFSSNKKLAKNRSKTIFKYLTQDQGIDKKRLSVEDYGERHIEGNTVADYLIEVYRNIDRQKVVEKSLQFSEFNPIIYQEKDQSYSLIINQFDTKKQATRFIKKLSKREINAHMIFNKFINVSKEDHQQNRKTTFRIIK